MMFMHFGNRAYAVIGRLHGEQRDQAHHGTDFERNMGAIQVHCVEVEFIFLVPQCSKNLVAMSSYTGLCRASSSEMRSRLRQYIASQLDVSAGGQRRSAVKDTDIVQAQKATLKDVTAFAILAVHPPVQVEHQLVEDTLREL
ncbi:MAG: hypothetical protein SFV51_18540 [Bryobacteraceae bacterium]|nr:hypothetical protein [Bryobacteraceae bacterium]